MPRRTAAHAAAKHPGPEAAQRSRTRAPSLPPAERRAEIVEAALALLISQGSGVTTRQIAEAAGVAEGTIFRVFADKAAILDAVVDTVFDPTPVRAALLDIDRSLPLEERLAQAVLLLQDRVAVIWQVMGAVGMSEPPNTHRPGAKRDAPEMSALAALFEPAADRLRHPPADAAQLLRSLTFACSFPVFVADEPRSPKEIVSLLLDGLRIREHPNDRGPSC